MWSKLMMASSRSNVSKKYTHLASHVTDRTPERFMAYSMPAPIWLALVPAESPPEVSSFTPRTRKVSMSV